MAFVSKEIKRLSGKAIHNFEMIRDGDHVVVAVSGGKDSMTLLWLLRERIKRIPIDYRITAVHVDPGFGADSGRRMEAFFTENGFEHRVVKTDIGLQAHGPNNRENPCFLCSHLRRKILFEVADEIHANRIALGHHKDDIIETFFINIFYGASVSTMLPLQELFNGRLTIIRPLYFIEEDLIQRYAKSMDWPKIELNCPTAGFSKREDIKNMLGSFYKSNRKIKGNVFHALQNVSMDYLP